MKKFIWIILVYSVFMFIFFRFFGPESPGFLRLFPVLYFLLAVSFIIYHGIKKLGGRNLLLFFLLSFGITMAAEQIGTATGVIFGDYSYNSRFRLFFGKVPIFIPFVWFFMTYCSSSLAEFFIFRTKPAFTVSQGFEKIFSRLERYILFPALTAFLLTGWDLILDPIAVNYKFHNFSGAWKWHEGGEYFGIPFSNYSGWLLIASLVMLLYVIFEKKQESELLKTPFFYYVPIFGYFFAIINNIFGTMKLKPLETVMELDNLKGTGIVGFIFCGTILLIFLSVCLGSSGRSKNRGD